MTETKDFLAIRPFAAVGANPERPGAYGQIGQHAPEFQHGRSKSVVVEKRKTRKLNTPGAEPGVPAAPAVAETAPVPAPAPAE